MKCTILLVPCFCGCLCAMPTVAGDSGDTVLGSAAEASSGKQAGEKAGAQAGVAEASVAGTNVTPRTKGKPKGQRRDAGTATLFRSINDQIKKGNIQIEGSTDTAPPP